jgi:hypothetical protein
LDTRFVITLGHFGEHVKEFLEIGYPERSFEFVEVHNYEGPGSSLARSMLAAEGSLQLPFIFHASDTLVLTQQIPPPSLNWVFGHKSVDASNYATFDVDGPHVLKFHEKGMTNFDFIHIGLIGVFNYLEFWESLKKVLNSHHIHNPSDVDVQREMLKKGLKINVIESKNWLDIGNSSALSIAKTKLGDSQLTLPKVDESIIFIGNSVIKFFADSNVNKNRIDRTKYLGEIVPKIINTSKHFFKYKYIDGNVLSKVSNPLLMSELLIWAEEKLWIKKNESNFLEFQKKCEKFYFEKTFSRLNLFYSSRAITDKVSKINGVEVPTTSMLLNKTANYLLQDIVESSFHGDFILDNIIYHNGKFKLIDWRQDFSGDLEFGDKYYDLAKLNHSLYINHDVVNNNLFSVSTNESEITCTIHRKDTHVEMQELLYNFIVKNNLSLRKVKVLTSIIWLNMAALHHHPFDLFLYYYGKLNLWKSLNDE